MIEAAEWRIAKRQDVAAWVTSYIMNSNGHAVRQRDLLGREPLSEDPSVVYEVPKTAEDDTGDKADRGREMLARAYAELKENDERIRGD